MEMKQREVPSPEEQPDKFGHTVQVFFHRFWKLAAMNGIYFVAVLPILTWFYLLINGLLSGVIVVEGTDALPGIGYYAALLLQIPPGLFYGLLVLSIFLSGPLAMGMTAYLRSMVRGEHMWFSDFFLQAKSNWKQGILFTLLHVLTGSILLWNSFGGLRAEAVWLNGLLITLQWLSMLLLILCAVLRPYLRLIGVSIAQPVRHILKNAWILSRVKWRRSLVYLFSVSAYWMITVCLIPGVSLVALPLVSFALPGYWAAVLYYPCVERYILRPARKESGKDIDQ